MIHPLDSLPPWGFNCGRDEQNTFLYRRAWYDQRRMISATRLFFVHGTFAAYITTMADAIELGTRERDRGLPYHFLPAIKLAQLAVDQRFAGSGLGSLAVRYIIGFVGRMSREVGCRYVSLDAMPHLEGWYAEKGFVRNKVMHNRRLERARAVGRSEGDLPVSMRYDLIEFE